MDALPTVGQTVNVHDPLGYSGTGEVTALQHHPHAAVEVRMATITDRADQSVVGRCVWVLVPHVHPTA